MPPSASKEPSSSFLSSKRSSSLLPANSMKSDREILRKVSDDEAASLEQGQRCIDEKDRELTRAEDFLCCCVFVIMGTAELYYWNSVLNVLYNVQTDIYPEYPQMTDTLNAVNNLGTLFVAALNIWIGAVRQEWAIVAGVAMSGMHVLTALCVTFARNKTGVVLLHLCNLVAGAAGGMFQSNSYGLAACMPRMFAGYISAGNGICGVITFALWMILSEAAFKPWADITPNEAESLTKKATWCLMGVGCVLMLLSTMAYGYLLRKPFCKVRVAAARKALKEELSNPDAPSYLALFQVSWKMILTVFFCLFITLFLFPNPGPLKWLDSRTQTNVVMGIFQVGDLIGRYLPTILPILLLPPRVLVFANLARVLFVVFFFLCYRYPDQAVWGSFGVHIFLMLVLAISNGWYCSCSVIHAPASLTTNTEWRSRVSAMTLVGLLLGITVGLWSSKIVFIWA